MCSRRTTAASWRLRWMHLARVSPQRQKRGPWCGFLLCHLGSVCSRSGVALPLAGCMGCAFRPMQLSSLQCPLRRRCTSSTWALRPLRATFQMWLPLPRVAPLRLAQPWSPVRLPPLAKQWPTCLLRPLRQLRQVAVEQRQQQPQGGLAGQRNAKVGLVTVISAGPIATHVKMAMQSKKTMATAMRRRCNPTVHARQPRPRMRPLGSGWAPRSPLRSVRLHPLHLRGRSVGDPRRSRMRRQGPQQQVRQLGDQLLAQAPLEEVTDKMASLGWLALSEQWPPTSPDRSVSEST
mmetsp:Transcript_18833/g.60032  ORF Transcript_18833/g.60032 Transcript_18833/m.60032 type:complete len:292 (-) Transcript_18833:330-1205(-)